MFESIELEKLLNEIGEINEKIFPAHIIIGIIAVSLTLWCYLKPNTINNRLMKGFLGIYYCIIVYTCVMCALNMQDIYYYLTVAVNTATCLVFIYSITKDEIRFGQSKSTEINLLSIIMTVYGIFLYPLVEIVMGYTWPRIFIFSFCPMGIFAIGIVITAYPRVYDSKTYIVLLAFLSFGAVVFGTRTVLIGGLFDFSYIVSGIIGFIILLRYGIVSRLFRNKGEIYGGEKNG